MKNRNMVIYIVIAILLIALLLWYVFAPKQKNAPAAPQPQASSVAAAPEPATVPPPPAPTPETTAPEQQATPAAPAQPANYTVVRGDCLWRIAARSDVYGNPDEWPLIYKANSDKITDADLIYPGQVLVINHHPSAAAVAAAIQHAKTRGPWTLGKVEASDKAYLEQ